MKSFLSALAGLPGNFPESCWGQPFERRAYSACFWRKKLQSNLFCLNFPELYKDKRLKSAVYRPAVFQTETPLQSSSWNFSKIFKTTLRTLSSNSFWIAPKPVDNKPEFLEITSRSTFRNIPMHVIEFSTLSSTKDLFLGISWNF